MTINLWPSHINYVARVCPRCWWLACRNIGEGKELLPAIFSRIDSAMKESITVSLLRELSIPAVEIIRVGKMRPKPLEYLSLGVTIYISGFSDCVVRLEDETFMVIDWKTTEPKPGAEHIFDGQLHCYVQGLENPIYDEPREVTRIALGVFTPYKSGFQIKGTNAALKGSFRIIERPVDRASFQSELEGFATVAASQTMPDSAFDCKRCIFVQDVNRFTSQYNAKVPVSQLKELVN